jgi:Gpi18-like mannosyltransferase
MMAAAAVITARALLPLKGPPNGDFPLFLIPWMDAVRERGLASISGEFSMYTPPYIYLLNIASVIETTVGTVAAIKLINVPFVALTVAGIGALVRQATADKDRATIATAVAMISPSLLLNAFGYGQCDVIFTAFVIWFVYFAVRHRPAIACVMFGLAVAFKLQAVFVSPLLVTMLLWRRMRFLHLFLIPLMYVVMMVPAAIAGRPWDELLTVYLHQSEVMHELSLNSPNPWWFLHGLVDYYTGLVIGLVAGVLAAGLVVWRSQRLPKNAISILLIAAASAALLPYVLPKMTERYFFVADMLTIALAFARPRLWPAAVLIQIGSVVASISYFAQWSTAGLAVVPITLGVGILVNELFREGRRAEPVSNDGAQPAHR